MFRVCSSFLSPQIPNILRAINIFSEMAAIHRSLGDTFKTKSYDNAVKALERILVTKPNTDITSSKDIGESIGQRLRVKTDEIIGTGKLEELDELKKKPLIQALLDLTTVHGIGPATAKALWEKHGICTVKDLQKLHFKSKLQLGLNDAQLTGLKYHSDLLLRIPYDEVKEHEAVLKQGAVKVDPKAEMCVCGSYRRQLPLSGDVDVLMTTPSTQPAATGLLPALVEALYKKNYMVATLALGGSKFMGIAKLNSSKSSIARRVDIRWVDYESFPAAQLYFTGSKLFNMRMRAFALHSGFRLNEYGVSKLSPNERKRAEASFGDFHKMKQFIPVKNEKEIFEVIGMPYVEPKDRVA